MGKYRSVATRFLALMWGIGSAPAIAQGDIARRAERSAYRNRRAGPGGQAVDQQSNSCAQT